MIRMFLGVTVIVTLYWLFNRLWPAFRTEPATWLGDDWRKRAREKIGIKFGIQGGPQ